MGFSLNGRMVVKQLLAPGSYSTASLGTAGGIKYTGYNRAFIICSAGAQTAGDSDDTVAWQVDTGADTGGAASDVSSWVSLGNGTDTTAAPADSTALALGDIYFDVDLTEVASSNTAGGFIRVVGTPAEGLTIPLSATLVLYRATGKLYDSDFDALVTIVKST